MINVHHTSVFCAKTLLPSGHLGSYYSHNQDIGFCAVSGDDAKAHALSSLQVIQNPRYVGCILDGPKSMMMRSCSVAPTMKEANRDEPLGVIERRPVGYLI
jgi:hypothetical protein